MTYMYVYHTVVSNGKYLIAFYMIYPQSYHKLKTSPISQEEIKIIGAVILAGKEC